MGKGVYVLGCMKGRENWVISCIKRKIEVFKLEDIISDVFNEKGIDGYVFVKMEDNYFSGRVMEVFKGIRGCMGFIKYDGVFGRMNVEDVNKLNLGFDGD
jgi:transcription antitermination factor NusG